MPQMDLKNKKSELSLYVKNQREVYLHSNLRLPWHVLNPRHIWFLVKVVPPEVGAFWLWSLEKAMI
jgi:hypothetical protein